MVFSGLTLWYLIQVHKYSYKWSLAIAGHQCDQLVLNSLDTALDLFSQSALCYLINDRLIHRFAAFFSFFDHIFTDLLSADIYKWSQMSQCK